MLDPEQIPAPGRAHRGRALRLALVGAAALAVLGFAAYQFLSGRPGEAAAALIPYDADVVVTLDTNPSERQLPVFLKITAALKQEGITEKLDELLSGALEGKPLGAEIQPHLQKSFAIGVWTNKSGPTKTLALLSIDSPADVEASLQRHGAALPGGAYSIPGSNDQMVATVVADYLVLADSEETLARMERVRDGSERSVVKSTEFSAARASLPTDANLMVFLAPHMMQQMAEMGGSAMLATSWMAYSATVVPEGIQFDYRSPLDTSKMKSLLGASRVAALDMGALKKLPAGAYGVGAYSQGGLYWESMSETLSQAPMQGEFKKGIEDFEKETGIRIAGDLVPALMGEQLLAVYPGDSGQPEDVDAVLLLTDSNGANPAALADKVRAVIERKSTESGKALKFVETKVGSATVWELDAESRKRLLGAIPGASAPPPEELPGAFAGNQPMLPHAGPPAFLAKKSVLYAQIGNSLLVTTSRGLVQRAIAAPASGHSLAEEPLFASAERHLVDGSQGMILVNLKRIMEAVLPSLEQSIQGGPVSATDIAGLFGDGLTPLVASGKFDGKVGTGRWLLPFDFEKAIHLIGSSMAGPTVKR